VPCPFFLPKEPLQDTGWAIPPRTPLGALCAGECHAGPSPAPADHDLCNFGYARGVCHRFPQNAVADAVRFVILKQAQNHLRIRYIYERAHEPQSHGTLTYSDGCITESEESPPLAAQAAAFARNSI
jgi:hypothetical protein